jgi:hypothetical protein
LHYNDRFTKRAFQLGQDIYILNISRKEIMASSRLMNHRCLKLTVAIHPKYLENNNYEGNRPLGVVYIAYIPQESAMESSD